MTWTGPHPDTLAGVRVVDLTRLLPGPFCTMLLADLGADVIKVEDTGGGDYCRWFPPNYGEGPDSIGGFFAGINRGKRGVSLDLKRPEGREALLALVATADVLIESFRPGVMERLGLGPDALRASNPGLVYCAISGFGQTGPYSHRAGHDLQYVALGGALDQTAPSGGAPHPPGFQLADVAGGALYATIGILGALFHKQRTGEGAALDISMTEGALSLLAPTLGRMGAGADPPRRGNDQLTGGLPCYRVYETSDGGFMALGALEPKFWAAFCAAVERPEWMHQGHSYDSPVVAEVAELFRGRTRAEWQAFFATIDVCCEPVLSPSEVLEAELHRAREVFFKLGVPGRPSTLQTATPITPSAGRNALRPPPQIGEHTVEVLREAGVGQDTIDALLRDGVAKQHATT